MEFNRILAELMSRNGWTQYRLAMKMDCSQSTVAHWLAGETTPSRLRKKQLAEVFGVPEGVLTGELPIDPVTEQKKDATENGDVMDLRGAIRDNPALRALFEASQGVPASRIYEAAAMLAKWKEEGKNDECGR